MEYAGALYASGEFARLERRRPLIERRASAGRCNMPATLQRHSPAFHGRLWRPKHERETRPGRCIECAGGSAAVRGGVFGKTSERRAEPAHRGPRLPHRTGDERRGSVSPRKADQRCGRTRPNRERGLHGNEPEWEHAQQGPAARALGVVSHFLADDRPRERQLQRRQQDRDRHRRPDGGQRHRDRRDAVQALYVRASTGKWQLRSAEQSRRAPSP
jgi:hypothetical protein